MVKEMTQAGSKQVDLNSLKSVKSAKALLEEIYGNISDVQLPVDVREVLGRLSKVKFSDVLSFDDWDNSGYIKVNRSGENKEVESIAVWVNPTEAPVRQRFTIAHELGHLIFDILPNIEDSNIDECFEDKLHRNDEMNYKETRANKFAAQLLMPADLVKSEVSKLVKQLKDEGKKASLDDIVSKLAVIFDVSSQSMEIRLKTLGYIS